MKFSLLIFLSFSLLISCNKGINDKSKRNENWAWWVDASTGKGKWIPIGDATTVKNGQYTRFYFNGNIFQQGKLIDGKNVDTIYAYNLDGKLCYYKLVKGNASCPYIIRGKIDTLYDYFITDGYCRVYNPNGNTAEEGVIKNHTFFGPWTIYTSDNKKEYTRNFVKDSSWRIDYYDNEEKKDSGFDFNNNGLFLVCKDWFENGQIKKEVNWKDGVENGVKKSYYENDSSLTSSLNTIGTFKNGIENGVQLQYYENGQLGDSMNIIEGKREGIEKEWNQDGKLDLIFIYKNGDLIRQKKYNESGKLIRDTSLVQ
jgi:antitoxin component YwqK of YwqJK toxin-antitoxin module